MRAYSSTTAIQISIANVSKSEELLTGEVMKSLQDLHI